MPAGLRARFWAESFCATASGALGVLTLFWRDWIEAVFHADPDQGSGALEWVIVAVLLAAALTLTVAARLEWHRAQPAAG